MRFDMLAFLPILRKKIIRLLLCKVAIVKISRKDNSRLYGKPLETISERARAKSYTSITS